MRTSVTRFAIGCAGVLVIALSSGCIIDDTRGSRGQPSAPSASVPDSGSPVRRESPTKTLDDAEPEAPVKREDGVLDAGPADRGR